MGIFGLSNPGDVKDFSDIKNVKKVLDWMLNYDKKMREHKKIIDGNTGYQDIFLPKQIFSDLKEFNTKEKLGNRIEDIWDEYQEKSIIVIKEELKDEDEEKTAFMYNIRRLPLTCLEVRMRMLGWIYNKKYDEFFEMKE